MNEKTLDVVGVILESLTSKSVKEDDMIDILLGQGFSLKEIESAFKWMAQTILSPQNYSNYGKSLRILAEHEKAKISPEAWGMLLKLKNLNIIDDELIEEILERAMNESLDEVNAEEMKQIVQMSLFRANETHSNPSITLLYH
ncbi:MAG: DUF494 family protein [Deltaproteobacteria bacterium]|nr:DUF494 family protein [Deltaproteobacteria bacterium]